MITLKRSLAILLAVCALLSLCACGGDKAEYKDDVAVSDLADKIIATNDSWSFTEMNDSYLEGAMKLNPSDFAEYSVNINAMGTTADEFGIFKAKDAGSVTAVKEAAEGYLSFRLDTWMDEYMPEEKPKLEKAEVKVCGLYVMYAILDDSARSAAFEAFEGALKK